LASRRRTPSKNQSGCLLVLSTAGSPHEAKRIAENLLRRRLAACVNLISKIQSHYWWRGKIENSTETLLLIKTTAARLENLTGTLKKLHSYDLPEIIALPIWGGDQVYLKWLKKSVKKT